MRFMLIAATIAALSINSIAEDVNGFNWVLQAVSLSATDQGAKFQVVVYNPNNPIAMQLIVDRAKVGTLAYDHFFALTTEAVANRNYIHVTYESATADIKSIAIVHNRY